MRQTMILFFILSGSILCRAQAKEPIISKAVASACEMNAVYIDQYMNERNLMRKSGFVIVRAGTGEGAKTLNHRFNRVTKWLKDNRKLTDLIYARGEPVTGPGRVELYLGDELFLVMLANKGLVPCMDCCGINFNGRGEF